MRDTISKFRWADVSEELMSEEAIRARHSPAHLFRISPRSYAVNLVTLPTIGVPMVFYVLSGVCRYVEDKSEQIPKPETIIAEGEFAEIGPGEYTFEVLSQEPVRAISVFRLPAEAVKAS